MKLCRSSLQTAAVPRIAATLGKKMIQMPCGFFGCRVLLLKSPLVWNRLTKIYIYWFLLILC